MYFCFCLIFELFSLSSKVFQFTFVLTQIKQIRRNNRVNFKFNYNHMIRIIEKLCLIIINTKGINFHLFGDYTCNLTVKIQLEYFQQFSFDPSNNAKSSFRETNTKLPIFKYLASRSVS